MNAEWLLPMLLLVPALCAGVCFAFRSARTIMWFCAIGTLFTALLSACAVWLALRYEPISAAGSWFRLDALSAYHLIVMMVVFSLSALFGVSYFRDEITRGEMGRRLARKYGGFWFGSLAAMMLVLISNNLAVMWVGIEVTTLITAFLICIHASPGSLEAMWKYLLMCSVGVAVAFIGTLLVVASSTPAELHGTQALLWTCLSDSVHKLNPSLLKAGFLFIVIGFGTKAGLAPMHNWLPDAHSQAPAPVSAVFSGFLLNAAFYCILRYLPLVEAATGNTGWAREILIVFGLLSILVAAFFIVAQSDVKRLLAYQSVEHMGIIALGIGIGGIGIIASLFLIFSHSLSKTMAFFCAGRMGQIHGTHDMRQMTNVIRTSRVWGGGLIISFLALLGFAPFALFVSEFLILKAAVDAGAYWTAGLYLAGIAIVFVGALRHVISMAWEPMKAEVKAPATYRMEGVMVFGSLLILLALGLWLPQSFLAILTKAANVLGGAL